MFFQVYRECGEIGRHDGLKIRCLVIGVRVQVPPFPFNERSNELLHFFLQFSRFISKLLFGFLEIFFERIEFFLTFGL